ncbi:MAG: hypothetical protein HZC50_01035 [Nitrospirae bacterium]|nr:hypothetical protein [Nitrospirota bacterium]
MMFSVVAAQKTHTIQVVQDFPSGKTSSLPGICVPPAAEGFSAYMALVLMYEGHTCHSGTASEESASKTDEKPTHESVGLMGQVASCRPFPPSSRDEVTERPGWQPRGLPDLSNFG